MAGDNETEAVSGRHHRRRPRKVVVYYFDSDSEENGKAEPYAATTESSNPPIEDLETFSQGRDSTSQVEVRCRYVRAPADAAAAPVCKPTCPEGPRIGSPTPMCFYAFGITTLLYNVHNAQLFDLNMATMGLVTMVGGLTQFVSGFFELINMNTLGCTISTTYGAFWMATTVLFLWPENNYVSMGDNYYTGVYFLVWFLFSVSLLAASLRSPFTCIALFILVPLNFLMQSIGFFMDSRAVARVAGYEGMLVGLLAMYIGAAFILRDVYGRSVLPILFQKNLRFIEW
ncbi:hypothetical protein JKF63_07724 [Porcisia hertigi]|uniref:GPR1/FUN34/yaaH family n=1 Tax=Porcisia hertigi TaxID=2761500 RepID=A0A836LLN8_9TRYP|nr:hypothetical protein JKF63_07724 [Porcisia hertigi]